MRPRLLLLFVSLFGTVWADDKPPLVLQPSKAQLDAMRAANPGPVFPKSDVPPEPSPARVSYGQDVSYLRNEKCFTFVPKASLLSVGIATKIEVLPDHPSLQGLGTYLPAPEFIARFKNQFLVLRGTSLGIGRVSFSSPYPTPADKIVIAVDPENVPAFNVVNP